MPVLPYLNFLNPREILPWTQTGDDARGIQGVTLAPGQQQVDWAIIKHLMHHDPCTPLSPLLRRLPDFQALKVSITLRPRPHYLDVSQAQCRWTLLPVH
jgi:hypothetical protein